MKCVMRKLLTLDCECLDVDVDGHPGNQNVTVSGILVGVVMNQYFPERLACFSSHLTISVVANLSVDGNII